MQITRRKKLAAFLVLGMVATGSAVAYWTTSGTGTGSAAVGTSTDVTITQTSTISGLTPGGTAQDIDFRITNPLATNQTVTNVVVSIAAVNMVAPDLAKPDCTAADFDLTAISFTPVDLPNGDTQFNSAGVGGTGATIALKNLATNQDNCKNATVDLAFSAS